MEKIKPQKELKGYKPLAVLGSQLVLYKSGYLYIWDNRESIRKATHITETGWKDCNRLFVRLFRREPRAAVVIDKYKLLVIHQKKIFLVDLKKNLAREVFVSREGFSNVLNICPTEGKYIAVWGDYGTNIEKQEIYIYGMNLDETVDILYTFPAGSIRHVHNIIKCHLGGYYIFTGDTENEAGIYKADQEFQSVTQIAVGKQKYRVVEGFDTENGLLYATDSVNEENYIYLLKTAEDIYVIAGMNGSCIYGGYDGNSYYFSTTVEPDENRRGVCNWLSNKRGRGILSDEVQVIKVDQYLNTYVMTSYKKDKLPMKLFQYGSVQFASGEGECWIYPVGVKNEDGIPAYIEQT